MKVSFLVAALVLGSPGAVSAQPRGDGNQPFHVEEATIDSIHAGIRSGKLSCTQLVRIYLERIAAYDGRGPNLNAIQNVNPLAMKTAAELDARFRASGTFAGPLHCIPVLLKDDINTDFMPTTYGSNLFKSFVPAANATVVNRLQAAGAIILAKANMGEFAQGYSGSAFGDCHNAYDPQRSPSGSSCGTAVGIAANFAAVGIGEDTEGSIRGPASHGSLVGLRPTVPLVSRAGVMPLAPTRDTLGPITRTVRDAAIVLDVIAGYDPADPLTARSYDRTPKSYTDFLVANGLAGMRFGVIRTAMSRDANPDAADYKLIQAAVTRTVSVLAQHGAVTIDPLDLPGLKGALTATGGGGGSETESAIDAFLSEQSAPPVHSLREIAASPLVIAKRREELSRSVGRAVSDPAYGREQQARRQLRTLIFRVMADNRLDALIYATYDHSPASVPVSTPGSNRALASALGFPAIAVPAGYFPDGLPIGVEFLARPFAEGTLLRAAFGHEKATEYRHPPTTVPPLPGEP